MSKTANNGRFVWYEQLAKDPQKAIDFYTDVVGWKTQPFKEGEDYVMWVGEQGPLGGVMKLPDEAAKMGTPPHWMAHVHVDNVDIAASQVKKLGGKVYKEPTDIPSVGRFAVIADPQGAVLSIFTPRSQAKKSRWAGISMAASPRWWGRIPTYPRPTRAFCLTVPPTRRMRG